MVESVGKSGGLALFWEDGCEVKVQNFSRRHINVVVHSRNMNIDWKFTGFFDHPDATKCYESCNLIKNLERLTLHPWVCIGDFNEVMAESKKLGRNTRQRFSTGS